MKEKPILFSTPMVESILEGRKAMTRRTRGLEKVNLNPSDYYFQSLVLHAIGLFTFAPFEPNGEPLQNRIIECKPAYNVGDHVWVRETFFEARKWKHAPLFSKGPDFIYRADEDAFIGDHNWKPSLFMPKEAARIWLEVTNVRCERLQDISKEDAIAEGVESIESPDFRKYKEYTEDTFNLKFATHSFFSLWRKINGKDSVAANPWVFVYEFKRIERP